MPLKDMAYTAEELAEQKADTAKCCAMPADYSGPKYPWGLELRLENSALEKLGLDISKFKGGQEVAMDIVAKVTGININEQENGERRACLTLVAAKIGIARERSDAERAETLYGEKKGGGGS